MWTIPVSCCKYGNLKPSKMMCCLLVSFPDLSCSLDSFKGPVHGKLLEGHPCDYSWLTKLLTLMAKYKLCLRCCFVLMAVQLNSAFQLSGPAAETFRKQTGLVECFSAAWMRLGVWRVACCRRPPWTASWLGSYPWRLFQFGNSASRGKCYNSLYHPTYVRLQYSLERTAVLVNWKFLVRSQSRLTCLWVNFVEWTWVWSFKEEVGLIFVWHLFPTAPCLPIFHRDIGYVFQPRFNPGAHLKKKKRMHL